MEKFILALLICTSQLVTAPFNVTRRENGDYFVCSGSGISCDEFCHGTCWQPDRDDTCECDVGVNNHGTFSTQSHKCESYDEGKEL